MDFCCVCGRRLTDPVSVELGIGPECGSWFHDEFRREWIVARQSMAVQGSGNGRVRTGSLNRPMGDALKWSLPRRDVNLLLGEAKRRAGWVVARTPSGYWRLTHPSGAMVTISRTPTLRAWLAVEAQMARIEGEATSIEVPSAD